MRKGRKGQHGPPPPPPPLPPAGGTAGGVDANFQMRKRVPCCLYFQQRYGYSPGQEGMQGGGGGLLAGHRRGGRVWDLGLLTGGSAANIVAWTSTP